jgi:transposase
MRARMGPKQAVVAIAHKIARVIYLMLTTRTPYQDVGSDSYGAQVREREVVYLRR